MHERTRGSAAMGRACNISGAPAAGKILCGHTGVGLPRRDVQSESRHVCLLEFLGFIEFIDLFYYPAFLYIPAAAGSVFAKVALAGRERGSLLFGNEAFGAVWPEVSRKWETKQTNSEGARAERPNSGCYVSTCACRPGCRPAGGLLAYGSVPRGRRTAPPTPQRWAAAAGPADWPGVLLRPCGRGFFPRGSILLFFAATSWSLVHFRTANRHKPTYRRWCTFVFHLRECYPRQK